MRVVYRNFDMEQKSVQRFLRVDPLAEEMPGWNPYHYVFNNPLLLIDPLGLSPTFPPANFKGGKWIDGDGIFNKDKSGNGYNWTSHSGEDKGYVSGTAEIVESNFTMLSYLGHQVTQLPNAVKTLANGAANAISGLFSEGNGVNGNDVLGVAGIQGGISQDRKGSSDAIIDFGGGDFPTLLGVGGVGHLMPNLVRTLKFEFDHKDAFDHILNGTQKVDYPFNFNKSDTFGSGNQRVQRIFETQNGNIRRSVKPIK
jgi:hypothetical protein